MTLTPPLKPSPQPARATYSRLRTGLLSLTPGDSKCILYCRGASCKYCIPQGTGEDRQAIAGLYSTWITEDLLAMGRLSHAHFQDYDIIEQFKKAEIRSVVNLEEHGEHSSCGRGVGTSGFSYDPVVLMDNNIFYYNFPLPDFGSCSSSRLLDICKVAAHALSIGRVAVHCHAGHGRTGMIIAALLMYSNGWHVDRAIEAVRHRRPQSVQSAAQVKTLVEFQCLLDCDGGSVIPPQKCTMDEYVRYSRDFLSKAELRLYGRIPKIIYICTYSLVNLCNSGVSLVFDPSKLGIGCFKFECDSPKPLKLDDDLLVSLGSLSGVHSFGSMSEMVSRGMNIVNVDRYIEKLDLLALLGFLDHFMMSSFHQLTTIQEIQEALRPIEGRQRRSQDWHYSLFILAAACRPMPRPLSDVIAGLVGKWLGGKENTIRAAILEAIK